MATSEKEIRALLEKYFDGETTLTEESRLREFFASAESVAGDSVPDAARALPDDLLAVRAMFMHFAGAAAERCPAPPFAPQNADPVPSVSADYEERPVASGRLGKRSASACEAEAVGRGEKSVSPTGRRLALLVGTSAAVVLLTVTLHNSRQPVVYCYVNGVPVVDPIEAAACARSTMELVSEAMSAPARSLAPVREVGRSLAEVENIFATTPDNDKQKNQ